MFVHWSRSRICSNSLRRTIVIALLVSSVLLVSHANAQNSDFTIVLLPDTQYYSQSYPQTFSAQAQWIANNAAALNTQLVIGLGDVVQSPGSASEWQNADAAVRTLDAAGIPYVIAIGNHDYDGNNPGGRTATMYNQYFGPPRYANYSWYKGQYPAGSNENFYAIVTVNSKQYLILVLELFPRDSALNWANSVLQANPSAEVIVVTHAHVYNDNSRIARCDDSSVDQLGVLNDNDGQRLWSKFLKQYSNISLVLNGHSNFTLGGIGNEGAARRADLGINGNLVNQMLSDYQEGPSGGNGYLRILTFHPSADTIDVTTYSPTLNSYYAGSLDKFTINWHTAGAQTPGAGTISGRIRSASSCASLPGITVSAGGASVVTDSNGRYSLSVSAPGTYTVTAQGNSAHLPQSGSIEVYPQYPASLKMTMDDAGSIAGRVVDGGGTPVQGASIAYTGGNIATNGTAITDGNGNYTTPPMSVGTYSLTASASGLPSSSQTATVNAASTTTINFALIPPPLVAPSNLTATATLSATNLTSGVVTTGSRVTTASVTPAANALILLEVRNTTGTNPPSIPSVNGNGLTWVQVATKTFGTIAAPTRRVTLFRDMGSAPTSGGITIDFGGVNQSNGCAWSVDQWTGVDTSGTSGSGAILQSAVNAADSATSITATLAAFASPNNAAYGAIGATGNAAPTVGSGFTALGSNATDPLLTEWELNTTGVIAKTSLASAIAAVAVEVKATSQINLSWVDNSDNETGFLIERSSDGTNFTQIATVGANITSYSDTGLSASTTYYYRVRASGGSGTSNYSNVASATTESLPGLSLSSVALSPTSVTGGSSSTGTVTLSGAAPAGGAAVTLSSSNTVAATVPASVTVAAGATSATFTVTTSAVSSSTAVTISGTFNGGTQTATLTVNPPSLSLSSVALSPTSVTGGSSSTGTVTLSGAAPAGGAAVTLSSSNTVAATVPASVTVAAGATSATFALTTSTVSSSTAVTISGTFNGGTQTATLTVNPPSLSLSSVALSPTSVTGGSSSTGTVTLSGAAPAGGAVVTLSSSNTVAATVPASVTVAAGATSATFTVTTSAVSSSTAVTISGTFNGGTQTATLTVNPPSLSLSSVALNPTSVTGGSSSTGTVTLSGAAPAGGAAVTLSSSNTVAATVPASVTVAAGATSATFTVTTSAVSSSTAVTISGTFNGGTQTATLTVNPPPLSLSSVALSPTSVTGGSSSTGTVTL